MPQAYFTRSEERISLKKALATASAFFMVEMAVIETASEISSSQISTSVSVYLKFPRHIARRRSMRFGSPAVCDGLQGGYPFTFTADDAPYPIAVLRRERPADLSSE